MKEYLIFSTEGATIAPDSEMPVNNCQLLGRAIGDNFLSALESLYNDNEWITKAKYQKSKCYGVQVVTNSQKDDINKIVEYLWTDELKNYEENGSAEGHIFSTLQKLRKTFSE